VSNFVSFTGEEIITGSKTFNAITNVNGILNVTNSQQQIRVLPSANGDQSSITFFRNTGGLGTSAGDAWTMGHSVGGVGGGNFAITRGSNLQALSIASTGAVTIPQSLAVPSISLNNTDLATTLSSKVDTTSAQTIGGNKTFSSQTNHSGGFVGASIVLSTTTTLTSAVFGGRVQVMNGGWILTFPPATTGAFFLLHLHGSVTGDMTIQTQGGSVFGGASGNGTNVQIVRRSFGITWLCHSEGQSWGLSCIPNVNSFGALQYTLSTKPWAAGSVNADGTKASDIGQNTFTVAHGLGSGQYDVYWDSGTFHPLGTAYPTFVQAYGDFRATVVNFSNTRIKVSTYFNTTLTDVPFCFQILV
jgi:hypothetical protein